jgi:catechol 2,3-dioxygenase-like lactoylglutathione lyase family enzyme
VGPALTHLALHVRDLDACVSFYRDFCGMLETHGRGKESDRVVWLAEPGKERSFIFVLIASGPERERPAGDFSHLGFACQSREAVDLIAARAEEAGILAWPIRDEGPPVGYYCGVRDPDGNIVEFSYGQPLGPGAPRID